MVLWALAFGGIPLTLAVAVPELLPYQLLELGVSFVATFFFWDRMQELLGQDNVLIVLVGGVFFLVGTGACVVMISDGTVGRGILIGVLFGGSGLGLLVLGLRRILRPPADVDGE